MSAQISSMKIHKINELLRCKLLRGGSFFIVHKMELLSILNFDKNEIVVLGKNPDSVQKKFL